MARDDKSDKSSKRRWGRGKAEEGPSDDELGWLADLRGGPADRSFDRALPPDEPPAGRGRRGSPPPPPPPPPAEPAGRRGKGQRGAEPAEPRGRGGRDPGGAPAGPPAGPPPGPIPGGPVPPPPAAPGRSGLRRTPTPAAPSAPPRAAGEGLLGLNPAGAPGGSSAPAGPVSPPMGGLGKRPAEPWPDHDLTEDVPRVRDEPPVRPASPKAPVAGPKAPAPIAKPPVPGPKVPAAGPVGPPTGLIAPPTGPIGPPTGLIPPPAGPMGQPGAPMGGPVPPMGSRPAPGAGPGAAGGTPVLPPPPVNIAKIKRAEMRRHLRIAQQLKVGTLVLVAVLLLAAYPVYLFTEAVTKDPVFGHLDGLDLPAWAAMQHSDAESGSRWCIDQCRFRSRTWASERMPDETKAAYEAALTEAGWRLRTGGICPTVTEGTQTCWQRDEYVLDMWVRAPICDLPPPRPSLSTKPQAKPSASAAAAEPSATATSLACPGALVTVQVFNAIDYHPVG